MLSTCSGKTVVDHNKYEAAVSAVSNIGTGKHMGCWCKLPVASMVL